MHHRQLVPDYPNKPMKGSIDINWWVLGTCFYVWNLPSENPNTYT